MQQKLTGMMLSFVRQGVSAERAVSMVADYWYRIATQAHHRVLSSDFGTSDPDKAQTLFEQLMFEMWVEAELGEGGRRALLYSLARERALEPNEESTAGAKDAPFIRSYGWVAEQTGLNGKDDIETVRRSVGRFRQRLRGRKLFVISGDRLNLHFTNGNKLLKALGL